jgi:sugar lactone lactonase YvrE
MIEFKYSRHLLRGSSVRIFAVSGICLLLALGLVNGSSSFTAELEVVAELPVGPGNITVTPDKRIILSLHPFYMPKDRVVELTRDGRLVPFPNEHWNREKPENASETLGTVLGIQSDPRGIVWMLDTGLNQGFPPKLVAWDTVKNRLDRIIPLPAPRDRPAIPYPDTAFYNDLAVDLTHRAVYISASSGIHDSALLVVDMETETVRRVLQGHTSVQPEDINLVMGGRVLDFTLPDFGKLRLLIGVNPIALDVANEWLYYGPMNGQSLYRIRTADLLDPGLTPESLASKVERYSDKPLCDGISTDQAGNIYISDLQANAIGVVTPDRRYNKLIEDPRVSWPESFSFGPDGYLYFVASQLHLSAPLHGGKGIAKPPFYVFRLKALAPGVVGR